MSSSPESSLLALAGTVGLICHGAMYGSPAQRTPAASARR